MSFLVLGQLPQRKIAPPPPHRNPKTNPKPNPNLNRGTIFLVRKFLVAPNPKNNPDLDQNPNPKRGAIFCWGQLSEYQIS